MPLPPKGSEERALIDAILAEPDEDTPRLVYADWLDEHDRPKRAELIRFAINSKSRSYIDHTELVRRTNELCSALPESEYTLKPHMRFNSKEDDIPYDIECPFERGMQTKLSIHPREAAESPLPASAARKVASLLRANPNLINLRIDNGGRHFFEALAKENILEQLHTLQLGLDTCNPEEGLTEESIDPHANPAVLLSSPHLKPLKRLSLNADEDEIGEPAALMLNWLGDKKATQYLQHIESLEITSLSGPATDSLIAQNPHWGRLKSMYLCVSGGIDQILGNLFHSPAGKALEHLVIDYMMDDTLTAQHFGKSGAVDGALKHLKHFSCRAKMDDTLVKALTEGIRNHAYPQLMNVNLKSPNPASVSSTAQQALESALEENRQRIAAGQNR